LKVMNSQLRGCQIFAGSATTDLHWSETSKGSADCNPGESHFCDRSIYDSFLAKFVHEAFRDLHEHSGLVERFAVGGEG
jgi:hypothetical protein